MNLRVLRALSLHLVLLFLFASLLFLWWQISLLLWAQGILFPHSSQICVTFLAKQRDSNGSLFQFQILHRESYWSWVRYFLQPQTIIFSKAQPAPTFVCGWLLYFLQMWNNLATKYAHANWGYKVCALLPPSSDFYHNQLYLLCQSEQENHHASALICGHQS